MVNDFKKIAYGALFVAALVSVVAFLPQPVSSASITITVPTQFKSNLAVTGAFSKGGGTFVIDDPLDPKNKLLYHSFVESPDVKNIYDGIVTLDGSGEATIALPAYFDALNNNVRYQFFAIGQPMPNLYVKNIEGANHFTLAGGVAGGQVSWQVTGIRHDPYIELHPIVPEVEKGPGKLVNKGKCLFEPLCD
jgi:hypothetical protein